MPLRAFISFLLKCKYPRAVNNVCTLCDYTPNQPKPNQPGPNQPCQISPNPNQPKPKLAFAQISPNPNQPKTQISPRPKLAQDPNQPNTQISSGPIIVQDPNQLQNPTPGCDLENICLVSTQQVLRRIQQSLAVVTFIQPTLVPQF